MNKLSRRFTGNWAKLLPTARPRRQQQRRRLMAENLEDRRLLAVDFNALHNYAFPTDVNGDNTVSPIDALVAINYINGKTGVGEGEGPATAAVMRPDVNGDGHVSPLDVLNVINDLAEGEAGNVVTFSHQATDLAGNPITSAAIGETFVLQTLVQDMRAGAQGVFAGYFDLDYDESLVRVNMRESQTIQFTGSPTGGTYQLSFNGQTTAPITFADRDPALPPPFNTDPNIVAALNASRIEAALVGLSNINLGDAEVVPFTGGTVAGGVRFNYEVKFGGQYAGTDVPKLVATNVQLTGGSSPAITVFNTSDELLVPSLAALQAEDPTVTAADRAALVARSEQTRSFTFAFPKYSSGQSGLFGVASPGSSNMIIDEIGAFTSNQTPGGGDQEVLVEVQVTALAGGVASFLGNPADQSPDHDVLVFGSDTAVSTADIGFMPLNLPITADITALPDMASVDENAGPVFINVLSNDSISTGTGPTITAPIPTTSANGGTVAQVQQGGVSGFNYTPAANFSGTDTFTYTITNGSATASATVTVTVNPVDNRPIISGPNSLNTNEDTPLTLSGFTIVDPDSNDITVTLTLTAPAAGTLSQSTFSGTPQQVTTALNAVTYTPTANSNTANTLNISANDGGLTGTKAVNITINPINDPPVNTITGLGTPPTVAVANTETHTFPSGTFRVTDPDAGNTLSVTVSVTNGTLTSGGNTGASLNFSGSSPVNIGNLVYDPTDSFVGTATLTIMSTDGTLSDTDTVSITVAPPQFPFAAADSYTAEEGTGSFVLSPSPLNNDLRDPGATLIVTDVTATSAQGTLTIANGIFTYTPPADPNFFGTETFTYTIEQDPAPSSTGDTFDSGTITIEIEPVNDGPVNTVPGARTVNEDATLSFTGANLVSIADIDAGDGSLTVTLTASNGRINVASGAGVSNNGSKNVSITGTVAQINNRLGGLTYAPDLNFNGSDQLTIVTNDNGNTGGGALSDTDTVNITISPINDGPTIIVPGSQSFFTDFDNRFTSTPNPFTIADVDAGGSNVQVDLTIADGTLSIGTANGVTVTPNPGGNNGVRLAGSIANINGALANGLTYRTSVPGAKTLSATVNDLGNTGGGGPLTATATVNVEVLDFVPVNVQGFAFIDDDGDNQKDSSEPGIAGVEVRITGTDFQGNAVNMTTTTDAHGAYNFLSLRPNAEGQPYTITQQQPAYLQGGSSQALVNLDVRGNVTVQSGSLAFGADGFVPEFADVWDVFDHADVAPTNSGVLFGVDTGDQDWSIFYGDAWDMQRYGNARLALNASGNSGVLTVFDSQLGRDRTANVSVNAGTLTYRGRGADRVYRVIGGSQLLGAATTAQSEGEAVAAGGANANTDSAVYAAAVDSIFDRG